MAARSRRSRTTTSPPPTAPVLEAEKPAVDVSLEETLLAKPDPRAQWFVVHTYSGYESKVKKNLEQTIVSQGLQDQIFRVIIPVEDEIEVRRGQRQTVTHKVFPGYLLILMNLSDESWHAVRNTPSVTGFISAQDERGRLVPLPLDEEEVRPVIRRMQAKAPRVRIGIAKGQAVRIVDGPFVDFIGTVDELLSEKGKVRVLVSFFGRETPVELDFLQVERL